jgi:predicted transcriptional regulator
VDVQAVSAVASRLFDMPDSMSEMLQWDLECETLLDCFHGLNDLGERVFSLLVDTDGLLTAMK